MIKHIYEDVNSKAKLIRQRFKVSQDVAMKFAKEIETIRGFDLTKYNSVNDLMDAIHLAKETKTQRKLKGKVLVFENRKCKIYRLDTFEACATYSSRGKWCVTNTEGWKEYNETDNLYVVETDWKYFDESFLEFAEWYDMAQGKKQGDEYSEPYAQKWYNTFLVQVEYDGFINVWNANDTVLNEFFKEFRQQLDIPNNIFKKRKVGPRK